ncbi:hypothetical protein [Xanthomonas cannabis]|uniref:hypothetical protein n=1 Tax=Xanthomonas cannabis TaxID=1885674 RepID=UPI0013014758|nr:hypothetical protein [Xanthomonas cannabis]
MSEHLTELGDRPKLNMSHVGRFSLGSAMGKLSAERVRVLDHFEGRDDDWKNGDFERALENEMGSRYGNFQTAKSTISRAHLEGRWPKTVERYVRNSNRSSENFSTDHINIIQDLNIEPSKD